MVNSFLTAILMTLQSVCRGNPKHSVCCYCYSLSRHLWFIRVCGFLYNHNVQYKFAEQHLIFTCIQCKIKQPHALIVQLWYLHNKYLFSISFTFSFILSMPSCSACHNSYIILSMPSLITTPPSFVFT